MTIAEIAKQLEGKKVKSPAGRVCVLTGDLRLTEDRGASFSLKDILSGECPEVQEPA